MGRTTNRQFLYYLMWTVVLLAKETTFQSHIPVAGGYSHITDGNSELTPNRRGMFSRQHKFDSINKQKGKRTQKHKKLF